MSLTSERGHAKIKFDETRKDKKEFAPFVTGVTQSNNVMLNFWGCVTTQPSSSCLPLADIAGFKLFVDGSTANDISKERCCPAWLIPTSEHPTMTIRQYVCTTTSQLPGKTTGWKIPLTQYYLTLREDAVPKDPSTPVYLTRPTTSVEKYCAEAKKLMLSYRKD